MENDNIKGEKGGAWTEETHLKLHANNFDFGLANYIVQKISPKSSLEFGGGLGFLSRYLSDNLTLEKCYSIEPNKIKGVYRNNGMPKLLTLDIFRNFHPHTINHKFDLVVSIEVAEHIPMENHPFLFDFLASHTKKWIVFSGARIGQGGHGHISERSESDWKEEFIKRNFIFDEIRTNELRNSCDTKNINHQKNILVFQRKDEYELLDSIEKLAKPYLADLLNIIQLAGQFLDGNLFYTRLFDAINKTPIESLKEKRRNFCEIALNKKSCLEVGFNAGHSALIMLLVNPNINIVCVDTCSHPYTERCFEYLERVFPDRLKLIKGNSIEVLPKLKGEKYDLIHLDGGKEYTIKEDLINCRDLVETEHSIIVDDTQNLKLDEVLCHFEAEGFIEMNSYKSIWSRTNNSQWKHKILQYSSPKAKDLSDTIIDKVPQETTKSNKTIIITFANYNYLEVLKNWVRGIRKLDLQNYLVISLDAKIHDYLVSEKIPSMLRPCPDNLNELWVHRLKIIQVFLNSGYDIIHSDADAVWVKNPLELLQSCEKDIIFSQGTYWPPEVHKEWGFVLCCGFFYLRKNKNTLEFIDLLCKQVVLDKDDQVSVNKLLFSLETKWTIPDDGYNLKIGEAEFSCYKEIIFGKNSLCEVGLLPHSMFQRIPEDSDNIFVKHILSNKNNEDIVTTLKKHDCYFENSISDSKAIWLSSFPRSGNTFLRTILWNCFGQKTASIYPNDLGNNIELQNSVGHVEHDNGNITLPTNNLPLIKTHENNKDNYPAIYVVRDGRSTIISFWKFYDKKIPLSDIIKGNTRFGSWQNNVDSWHPWDRPNTLFLRYEEMRDDLANTLKRISDFLDLKVIKNTMPDRENLSDGKWIKKKSDWRDEFSDSDLALFYKHNGEMLKKLGYV